MPKLDGGLPSGRNVMTDRTVGQLKPAALQSISTGSGRSPAISRSATPIGTLESAASATTVSSYLPSLGERRQCRLVHVARAVQFEHQALRGAVIARTDARADFVGDFFQDAANFAPAIPGVAEANSR